MTGRISLEEEQSAFEALARKLHELHPGQLRRVTLWLRPGHACTLIYAPGPEEGSRSWPIAKYETDLGTQSYHRLLDMNYEHLFGALPDELGEVANQPQT